jgi:hypothetical protein
MLNNKLNQIDSNRSSAIYSLHKKLFSTVNLRSGGSDTGINSGSSPATVDCNGQPQCQEFANRTPAFSSPSKGSAGISISLGRQRAHSPEVDTPEFSFGVHPHTTAKSSRLLTQKTVSPCNSGSTAVEDGNAAQCNIDFSNNSYDLQRTCHQLSTVLVSRAGGSRFKNCAKPFKTARLFQENLNPLTDVPDKNLDDGLDQLGDDIMAEVMAIGK